MQILKKCWKHWEVENPGYRNVSWFGSITNLCVRHSDRPRIQVRVFTITQWEEVRDLAAWKAKLRGLNAAGTWHPLLKSKAVTRAQSPGGSSLCLFISGHWGRSAVKGKDEAGSGWTRGKDLGTNCYPERLSHRELEKGAQLIYCLCFGFFF